MATTKSHLTSFDETFNTHLFDSENEDIINYVSNKMIGIEDRFINNFGKKLNLFSNEYINPSENTNNNSIQSTDNINNFLEVNQDYNNIYKENLNYFSEFKNNLTKKENFSKKIPPNLENLDELINSISIKEIIEENNLKINPETFQENNNINNINHINNSKLYIIENQKKNNSNKKLNLDNFSPINLNSINTLNLKMNNNHNLLHNQDMVCELFEFLGEFFYQINEINKLLMKVVNSNYSKNQKIKHFQNKYQEMYSNYRNLILNNECLVKELNIKSLNILNCENTIKNLEEENLIQKNIIQELKFNLNQNQNHLNHISSNRELLNRHENLSRHLSRNFSSVQSKAFLKENLINNRKSLNILNSGKNDEKKNDSSISIEENNLNFSNEKPEYLDFNDNIIYSDNDNEDKINNQNFEIIEEINNIDLHEFEEENINFLKKIEILTDTLKEKDNLLKKTFDENNFYLSEIKNLKQNKTCDKKEINFLIYEIKNLKKENEYDKRLINILNNKIICYKNRNVSNYNINTLENKSFEVKGYGNIEILDNLVEKNDEFPSCTRIKGNLMYIFS